MRKLVGRGRRGWRSRRAAALGATALAVGMAVPAVADADWYLSMRQARWYAKDYVSRHYADTYASDLTTVCRAQGGGYDSRYLYHRLVCGWFDSSDGTKGAVLIVGSRRPGVYYGRVLVGAH
jgi:hypothetical protein